MVHVFQKDQELVAAGPDEDIFLAEQRLQQMRQLLQDFIPEEMAVAIIDILEKVHVDDQQAAGGVGVLLPQVLVDEGLTGHVVVQQGQGIPLGPLAQTFFFGLFQGDVPDVAQVDRSGRLVFRGDGVHLVHRLLALRSDAPQLHGAVETARQQLPDLPAVFGAELALADALVPAEVMLDLPPDGHILVVDDHGVLHGKVFKQIRLPVSQQAHQSLAPPEAGQKQKCFHGGSPLFIKFNILKSV